MTAEPASSDFEDFAAALPDHVAPAAYASTALADAYWRARRSGHTPAGIHGQTLGLANAHNPVGALVTRLRALADQPPPRNGRAGGGAQRTYHIHTHTPCRDGHDGCVLCHCGTGPPVHHVPTPMPDWFRQQWKQLRMNHVGAMPDDDTTAHAS